MKIAEYRKRHYGIKHKQMNNVDMIFRNYNQRCEPHDKSYAENLLLQVRFPLLLDVVVKLILSKTSSFQQAEECLAKIDKILKYKINIRKTIS